jgi:hypothetical protein
MTRRILRLLLVGALLAPAVVAGQENQVSEIVGVRVGFAGRYKVGLWTPVEVRLRGDRQLVSGEVRLTVPDGDGVPSRVRVPVGNGETSVPMYARFGRIDSRLGVTVANCPRSGTATKASPRWCFPRAGRSSIGPAN